MAVSLALGVLNAGVWLNWCIRNWRPYSHKAFVFFLLLHVFALFEVTLYPHAPRHTSPLARMVLCFSWISPLSPSFVSSYEDAEERDCVCKREKR
jgi:hypothetical protein